MTDESLPCFSACKKCLHAGGLLEKKEERDRSVFGEILESDGPSILVACALENPSRMDVRREAGNGDLDARSEIEDGDGFVAHVRRDGGVARGVGHDILQGERCNSPCGLSILEWEFERES